MPDTPATCAHCRTPLLDASTVRESTGKAYCCANCELSGEGMGRSGATIARCAHCETPLVDESTVIARRGQTYCCRNCALAMAAPGMRL